MKVALIGRGFSSSWGGAERVAVNLARAFASAGHEVDVYAERVEEGEPPVDGVTITKVPTTRIASSLRHLSFNKNLRRLLQGKDHNVVFGLCQFYPLDIYRASGGVHAHWMKLSYPNPVWRFLKYLFSPVHAVICGMERRIMEPQNHSFVITNSRLVKGHMQSYFGLTEDEVRVVYNGVDHKTFNPGVKEARAGVRAELALEDDDLTLLFVSNNWKRKGLETILRAMASFKGSRRVKLIVVGRAKERDKRRFVRLMESLGLSNDAVVFAGPRKDVASLYGAADIFVLPTKYDPCSNACLEAMATGLPVITTKDNGAAEFIDEGKSGYILNGWDACDELAAHIESLSDDDVRRRMGALASEAMEGRTWDVTMQETLKLLETALVKKATG